MHKWVCLAVVDKTVFTETGGSWIEPVGGGLLILTYSASSTAHKEQTEIYNCPSQPWQPSDREVCAWPGFQECLAARHWLALWSLFVSRGTNNNIPK